MYLGILAVLRTDRRDSVCILQRSPCPNKKESAGGNAPTPTTPTRPPSNYFLLQGRLVNLKHPPPPYLLQTSGGTNNFGSAADFSGKKKKTRTTGSEKSENSFRWASLRSVHKTHFSRRRFFCILAEERKKSLSGKLVYSTFLLSLVSLFTMPMGEIVVSGN